MPAIQYWSRSRKVLSDITIRKDAKLKSLPLHLGNDYINECRHTKYLQCFFKRKYSHVWGVVTP